MFDDDDDDGLFLWNGGPTKGVKFYFQLGSLLEAFVTVNLRILNKPGSRHHKPRF